MIEARRLEGHSEEEIDSAMRRADEAMPDISALTKVLKLTDGEAEKMVAELRKNNFEVSDGFIRIVDRAVERFNKEQESEGSKEPPLKVMFVDSKTLLKNVREAQDVSHFFTN